MRLTFIIFYILWTAWCPLCYTYAFNMNEKFSPDGWDAKRWMMFLFAPIAVPIVFGMGISLHIRQNKFCYVCQARSTVFSPAYGKAFCTAKCFNTWLGTQEGRAAFVNGVKEKLSNSTKEVV